MAARLPRPVPTHLHADIETNLFFDRILESFALKFDLAGDLLPVLCDCFLAACHLAPLIESRVNLS